MTKLYITHAKLQNLQNEHFAEFRSHDWLCLKHPDDVQVAIYQDVPRKLRINDLLFSDSLAYQALSDKRKKISDEEKQLLLTATTPEKITEIEDSTHAKLRKVRREEEEAINQFLRRALFQRQNVDEAAVKKVIKFHNQFLMSSVVNAINSITCSWQPAVLLNVDYTANITRNAQGEISLSVTCSDMRLVDPTKMRDPDGPVIDGASDAQNGIKYRLPGTITTEFVLTDQGFKFNSLDCSNSLLENLCLKNAMPEADFLSQLPAAQKAEKNKPVLSHQAKTSWFSKLFAWLFQPKAKNTPDSFTLTADKVFSKKRKPQVSTHQKLGKTFSQAIPVQVKKDKEPVLADFEKRQNQEIGFFGRFRSLFQSTHSFRPSPRVTADRETVDRVFSDKRNRSF